VALRLFSKNSATLYLGTIAKVPDSEVLRLGDFMYQEIIFFKKTMN
jgi:hypothetical protein